MVSKSNNVDTTFLIVHKTSLVLLYTLEGEQAIKARELFLKKEEKYREELTERFLNFGEIEGAKHFLDKDNE